MRYPTTALAYLVRQRFDTAETAEAAGLPLSRFADWLKRGVFAPLLGAHPGTGRTREFVLADVYRAAVVAALTEPDHLFSISIGQAVTITDDAFGLLNDNADFMRECLQDGTLSSAMTERDPARTQWLVAGDVDVILPTPGKQLRATLTDQLGAHQLPNPHGRPRRLLAVEVTPLFQRADHALLRMRGVDVLLRDPSEADR